VSSISSSAGRCQVSVGHGRVLEGCRHDRPADQFTGEGCCCSGGTPGGGRHSLITETGLPAVKLKERNPLSERWQRDLNGKIHPARALGQCAFQHVRAVGCQDERDVGIVIQAVHGIKHLKEQRLRPVAETAVFGDEVAVLQHHYRGL
jgi:hypothetical protein